MASDEVYFYARAPRVGDDARLHVRRLCVSLSHTSGLSLEQRGLGRLKIGTEVGHVTRDSDTTFQVKGQLAGGGAYCGSLPHSL